MTNRRAGITAVAFSPDGRLLAAANIGGSVFTPDGATLYSAFNTAANTNPPSPSSSSTLFVNDPSNLGIRLGIKLPESIVAKVVATSDGAGAWGLSDSGLVHLPLGHLYDYPIIMPETTQVFLAMDDCNRGVASGTGPSCPLWMMKISSRPGAPPSAARQAAKLNRPAR